VALSIPIKSGTDAGKYTLKSLIEAIGGDDDCGIKLYGKEWNAAIGVREAQEFIDQVNAFRKNHAKALAEAEVTVAVGGSTEKKTVFEVYDEVFQREFAKRQSDVAAANAAFEKAKKKFSTAA
jgi:hypothetical protein